MQPRRIVTSLLAASAVFLNLVDAVPAAAVGFEHVVPTLRQHTVLAGILAVTQEMARQGRHPVSVFDLDATIYEAGCRHQAIMSEFAKDNEAQYPGMAAKVAAWVPDELPYEVTDTFAALGITSPAEQKRAKAYWHKRFFSNDYLHHDNPIAGAVTYVTALSRAGGIVVYLTGRSEKDMRAGTLKVLETSGFPIGQGKAELLMNPKKGLRDATFKGSQEVHDKISALGPVIAIFDNEPGNVNALQHSFPEALTVFLDTNHSPGAPDVAAGIPWIKNFRWSWLPR